VNGLSARISVAAALGVVALLVLTVTLLFLGHALMLLFEDQGIRPSGAAGLTGLVGLVLVAVFGLLAKWAMRSPRRGAAAPAASPAGSGSGTLGSSLGGGLAADLGALAAQQIASATRNHPYRTMGAALAAGLAVGALPELRKALLDLLKK
jgi:hypothetical protein